MSNHDDTPSAPSPYAQEFLTLAPAARIVGVSEQTLIRWGATGQIEEHRDGRGWRRYRLADLLALGPQPQAEPAPAAAVGQDAAPLTPAQAVAAWTASPRFAVFAATTQAAYRDDAERFAAWLDGCGIDEIRVAGPKRLREFLDAERARGAAASSVERRSAGIRAFLRWLGAVHHTRRRSSLRTTARGPSAPAVPADFGPRLLARLDELRLTRGDLAAMLGTHRTAVGDWIIGRRAPQRRAREIVTTWLDAKPVEGRCARCWGVAPTEHPLRMPTGEPVCAPCSALIVERGGQGGTAS